MMVVFKLNACHKSLCEFIQLMSFNLNHFHVRKQGLFYIFYGNGFV